MGDTNILWNTFSDKNDLDRFLQNGPVWQTSGPIWKRSSLLSNGLLFMESAKSSQDWEFHVKALFKNMSFKKIETLPDYFVRRNPQQSKNAISSGHNDFEKLINRIQLYAELFDVYKLNKHQSRLLFNTINKEVFHTYHTLTQKQLKILWNKIQSIDSLDTSRLYRYAFWYGALTYGAKLTFKKSHSLVYFAKRFIAKNRKVKGYRSIMTNEMMSQLKHKLKS